MTPRCLGCYLPLEDAGAIYHPACSRRLFGLALPPSLPYGMEDLERAAKETAFRRVVVPGVQRKLSLHIERGQGPGGRLTIAGLWGSHVLKPQAGDFPCLPENEDLTMHMAEACGIETVPHGLLPLSSGELAYITRRIDRTFTGRGRGRKSIRIHMEDMAQLTGKLTEQKYRGSMEQVARAVRKWSENPGFDLVRLFQVCLFCFLTGNGDMHLKNFSLLETETGFRLSPAYDLLSTRLVIPESADPEESALSLGGKRAQFHRKDFESFGLYCGLTPRQMENVFSGMKAAFPAMIDFLGKGFLPGQMADGYRHLLSERADRIGLEVE